MGKIIKGDEDKSVHKSSTLHLRHAMSSSEDPFLGDNKTTTEVRAHPLQGHLVGIFSDIDNVTAYNESAQNGMW